MQIPTEKNSEVNKLLIYCRDERYSAYRLGEDHIYMQTYRIIHTNGDQEQADQPAIAYVFTNDEKNVLNFIQKNDPKAVRIFKTVRYKDKFPVGFMYNCAKNLLGLMQGKWIRIRSEDEELRNKFYEVFKEVNEEWNFNCILDFDEYDIEFVIKTFKDFDKNITVTYFYGKEYPNIRLVD